MLAIASATAHAPPVEGVINVDPIYDVADPPDEEVTHRDLPTANLLGWFPGSPYYGGFL